MLEYLDEKLFSKFRSRSRVRSMASRLPFSCHRLSDVIFYHTCNLLLFSNAISCIKFQNYFCISMLNVSGPVRSWFIPALSGLWTWIFIDIVNSRTYKFGIRSYTISKRFIAGLLNFIKVRLKIITNFDRINE